MSDLEELLRGPVARWVGQALMLGAAEVQRAGGRVPAAVVQRVMDALDSAVGVELPVSLSDLWDRERAAGGTSAGRMEVHGISVSAAAREVDRSERYIRRLAEEGQIVARRFDGPNTPWLIDLASLRSVIGNSRRKDAE